MDPYRWTHIKNEKGKIVGKRKKKCDNPAHFSHFLSPHRARNGTRVARRIFIISERQKFQFSSVHYTIYCTVLYYLSQIGPTSLNKPTAPVQPYNCQHCTVLCWAECAECTVTALLARDHVSDIKTQLQCPDNFVLL